MNAVCGQGSLSVGPSSTRVKCPTPAGCQTGIRRAMVYGEVQMPDTKGGAKPMRFAG